MKNKFNVGDAVDIMGNHCRGFVVTSVNITRDKVEYGAEVLPEKADGSYIAIQLRDLKEGWLSKSTEESFNVDRSMDIYAGNMFKEILEESRKRGIFCFGQDKFETFLCSRLEEFKRDMRKANSLKEKEK